MEYSFVNMARIVLAVIAGYVVMASLSIAAQMLVIAVLGMPAALSVAPAYLTANLVCSLLCGAAGGWLAARIARQMQVSMAVAVLVLVLGIGLFVAFGGAGPAWYSLLLPVFGASGAAGGGVLQRNLSLGAYRWRGRRGASGKNPWISEA